MRIHERRELTEKLRGMRGKPISNAPVGLPRPSDNTDASAPDGFYHDDGTFDPGIQHGVTGSGNGPITGRG